MIAGSSRLAAGDDAISTKLTRADETARAPGRPVGLPEGVVTLVFTDIEASTRLLRRLGERFGEWLAAHHDIVEGTVVSSGGVVVRVEGDSFFCAFSDPAQAVAACLTIQRRLADFKWPADADFKVRIGVHTGPVELGGGDYIGMAVHQAARVAATPHGGQTVISEGTRQILGDRLPTGARLESLGRYRLKDVEEPVLLYQLCHPDLSQTFPALRALPAAAHNVPEPATLFIGRTTALSELARLVGEARLVTVTGAGGVGKTRLATEVVPLVVPAFPDGVWMVELAKLRDGQAVEAEIAATLSVRVESDRRVDELLAEALAAKRLLLMLDNCEHVLDELAPLVQGLTAACPGVHVLATSREPLALPGERRYPLAPLTLPHGNQDELEPSEAVALFVDRARVVAPEFTLAHHQAAVVEICRRLDGLPLAIELAAARTAAIPPGRMAARLDRRFSVLRRSHRGRLPHHETLRASIEWSYELLDAEERTLLARLAVFTGEFELEAAEVVCGGPPLDSDDVLELLGRLIEKSLLQPVGDRYLMLESIREFAREQAERAGEVEALVAAHLAYYTGLVEQAAAEVDGAGQRQALDRLDAELPNIRAAVQRALERSHPEALRLGAQLGQYGFIRNRLVEVAQWCIDAAAIPDAPAALRAGALLQAGFALTMMGSQDAGQALVDDAVVLAREAGETILLVQTLLMAADMRLEVGRDPAARLLAAEAVALVSSLHDEALLGRALLIGARADHERVGPVETARRLSDALSVFERVGDRRMVARVLLTLAYLWLEAGELEAARGDAARCLAICTELDHPIGEAIARIVEVWVEIDRGCVEAAHELLAQSLTTARNCGYRTLLAYCLAAEAALCVRAGACDRAAVLLGALSGATGSLGGEGARAIDQRLEALRDELASVLGPRFAERLREGEALPFEELAAPAPPRSGHRQ